jgi:hypothetical protein
MTEILEPDLLIDKAQREYLAANYSSAAEHYKAAKISFQEKGDLHKMAEMANNCSVSFLQAKDAVAALHVLDGMDDIYERMGDVKGRAITFGNQAAALEALNNRKEAAIKFEMAAELFRRSGEQELYATTMKSLSALQLRTGRSLEALVTMRSGINQIERPNITYRILKRLLEIPYRLMNR